MNEATAPHPQLNQVLLSYFYLQVLDFLTTIAFLLHGVQEANPIVRFAIASRMGAITGLFLVKAIAFGLGVYCWRSGKRKLLSRINLLFAALIAWNLLAIIRAAAV